MFVVAIAVIPMIAFIGVRISWDMLDKNSLLAWLAFCASTFSFSDTLICSRE